jgi:hypothetical protein
VFKPAVIPSVNLAAARPLPADPRQRRLPAGDPARSASEFITVPAPVCSPQPNGTNNSSGSDLGTGLRRGIEARPTPSTTGEVILNISTPPEAFFNFVRRITAPL